MRAPARIALVALAATLLAAPPARAYFENVAVGARALALGPSGLAIADDATSYYWNPAALATLARGDVVADYAKPYGVPDLNEGALALAVPRFGVGWGLAWHRLALGSSYAEDQFCAAAGRRLFSRFGQSLDGGLTFKFERISIPTYYDPDLGANLTLQPQAKGSLDAALRWRTPWGVDFSWVGRDLNQPRFQFVAGSGGQQQSARAELAAAIHWHPESTILAGWSQYPGGGSSVSAGLEIEFYKVFAIRSGLANLSRVYQAYGSPAELEYDAGFGVYHHGYYVDAAATTNRDLGASYRLTVRTPLSREVLR